MTVQKVLDVERGQLGYTEGTNNKTKFGAEYGMDHASWCNQFQWWSFHQAGENIIGKFAYVPYQMDWFKDRKAFYKSKSFWNAHRGDLAFWDWEGNGIPNHIEMVEGFTGAGNVVDIGGNTGPASNKVLRQARSLGRLLGVGRPNYSDAAALWPGHTYKLGIPYNLGNVGRIQKKLGVTDDGDFGKKTDKAVRDFQHAHKLGVDGQVGMDTWHAIF